jgi:hypothetical protein
MMAFMIMWPGHSRRDIRSPRGVKAALAFSIANLFCMVF